jgi:hypothetical protein
VLPHVVAHNTAAAPGEMGRVARILDASDAVSGRALNRDLGVS